MQVMKLAVIYSLPRESLFTTMPNAINYHSIAINCHFFPWIAPFTNYLPEKHKDYSLPKNRNSLPRITRFTTKVSSLTVTFSLG